MVVGQPPDRSRSLPRRRCDPDLGGSGTRRPLHRLAGLSRVPSRRIRALPRLGPRTHAPPRRRLPLARRLDGRSVADPEKPGVTWSYALRDGEFRVERKEAGAVERFVIDYAFGSDHHATTFVSLIDPSAPNPAGAPADALFGGRHPGPDARTEGGAAVAGNDPARAETVARGHPQVLPVPLDADVDRGRRSGAERPDPQRLLRALPRTRAAHVAAARAGRTDLSMPFGFENWTAESQLALCGQCHRHPSRAVPGLIRPENTALARFQPVGISQSKCYTQSAGAFSCVTCHDPHARASSNRAGYEPACLKCHERRRRQD